MEQKTKRQYNKKKPNETTSTPQEALSTDELYNVFKFAQEYYKTYQGQNGITDGFQGAYNPYLTNQRLSEIGLSPRQITTKELQQAFNAPINNQETLIGYSEFLKFTEMISKRTMLYLGNLPSFDYTFYCPDIENESEYESAEYKQDLKTVKDFLSRFDVRGQFSFINRRTLETDAFYSVFRMNGNNYEFQELPYPYCRITGKNTDWGFLFDFDMNWFLKMGLSLDQYPPIFKQMYKKATQGIDVEKYDPSNPLYQRDGTFALWCQTSPLPKKGNFTCFKWNSDIYASIPFLTPLFNDSINKPLLRELQTNQYIIASQKILVGLIPLLKEQKSGQVKDALAVSPETMGKFLGFLKQGLSDAIKISGVPFADVKDINFQLPEHNMYDEYNRTLSANSGVTSRLMYASDKMTSMETKLSAEIDEMISNSCYAQYSKWLSTMVSSLCTKYRFIFTFKGTKYKEDIKFRRELVKENIAMGIWDDQEIASSLGMNVFELEEHLQSSKKSKIFNLLRLPPNANTMSMGAVGGRPKSSIPSDSADRNNDTIIE